MLPPARNGPDRLGSFIAVVGPSGAGKDTLLALAREALAGDSDYVFARRIVTRRALPSAEDHDSLDIAAFLAAEAEGRFCITWQAHGLHYGLPCAAAEAYEHGATVVSNVSRAAMERIAKRFPNLHVIEITAPRDVLVERLVGRGRETRAEIEVRLARAAELPAPAGGWSYRIIENAARAEDAAALLISAIRDPAGSRR